MQESVLRGPEMPTSTLRDCFGVSKFSSAHNGTFSSTLKLVTVSEPELSVGITLVS